MLFSKTQRSNATMLPKRVNQYKLAYILVAVILFNGLFKKGNDYFLQLPGTQKGHRSFYPKLYSDHDPGFEVKRSISINLGGGKCIWTESKMANQTLPLFSTVLTAYPGSGKRTAFMQLEGMTELMAVDDFNLSPNSLGKRYAYLKSSYPQHEGIWSWEDRMSQVILLLRNPRWSFPSYQHLLYEINYSKDWQTSYDLSSNVYTKRPPIEDWEVWRDLRVDDEIEWWRWHLDYWMEGGIMRDIFTHEYTTQEHFHRLLHSSGYQLAELMRLQSTINLSAPLIDPHCENDIGTCVPVAVASFEKMLDEATGPDEIGKFINVIQDKEGIEVIAEEARTCVWKELIVHQKGYVNTIFDREESGPAEEEYVLTVSQMEHLIEMLQTVIAKYSSGEWLNNALAQEVVVYVQGYLLENQQELGSMI